MAYQFFFKIKVGNLKRLVTGLILFTSSCYILNAQNENLVLNPGFEEVLESKSPLPKCAYAKNTLPVNKRLENWQTFEGTTPDLILWEEGCFYLKPHNGDNMIGLITYHPGYDTGWSYDYHEFVQGELKAPLQRGKTYQVEFFINQDDSTAVHHLKGVYGTRHQQEIIPGAANNLSIWFLVNPLSPNDYMWDLVQYEAAIPQVRFYEPVSTEPGQWKRMNKSFVADEAYRYFVIGNFHRDRVTRTNIPDSEAIDSFNLSKNKFWEKKKRVAYYCLDDIRVYQSSIDIPSKEPKVKIDLASTEVYTFQHVNFESGKATLLPSSYSELDDLIAYLQENQSIGIEIGGHTDNIGNEFSNHSLSEQRARSVYDYLIGKGIAAYRLKFKGYGELLPISENSTAEGRKLNRRVEVKIIH